MIQTGEGALNETQIILQRMRELAVQSYNDTNTDDDRKQLQSEITQLNQEVDRIGNTTEFNTKKLLDGSCKGVSAAVAGTMQVNNNSSMTVNSLSTGGASVIVKKCKVDRAYMLVRVAAATAGTYTAADFKVIGPDGKASTDITITSTHMVFGSNISSTATNLNL